MTLKLTRTGWPSGIFPSHDAGHVLDRGEGFLGVGLGGGGEAGEQQDQREQSADGNGADGFCHGDFLSLVYLGLRGDCCSRACWASTNAFKFERLAVQKDAVLLDPGVDRAKRFGIELVDTVAAFAVLADQMRAAEQAQVLGNGRTGDWKSLGDLSGGLAAAAEQVEDGAAGGIGEGLEGGLGYP